MSMNTETDSPAATPDISQSLVPQVIAELDRLTTHMPVDTMLSELLAVVERLTFSGVTRNVRREPPRRVVEGLLQHDISKEVLEFTLWMADHKLLQFLSDQGGRWFLAYCNKYYSQIKQVLFITAIELKSEKRAHVLERLRHIYPAPARIVFQISPSILAGCIIDDGSKRTDYSLRKTMSQDIRSHLSRHYGRPQTAPSPVDTTSSKQLGRILRDEYETMSLAELEALIRESKRG